MWQRKYAVAAIIWMCVIWFLSDQPYLQSGLEHDFWWRKLAHVFEYGLLTWLWARAFGSTNWRSVMLAAGIALTYAGIDEWHQGWVEGRNASSRDVVIDAVGVLLAVSWLLFGSRRRNS